ncbi:MAG: class I SAM-dependent methyltransferase [Parasporobacterium sp.]|nr:class I SAM-dependent methyltransferase [Parasporobacterium sp.]
MITVCIRDSELKEKAGKLAEQLQSEWRFVSEIDSDELYLLLDSEGLSLVKGTLQMYPDLRNLIPRIRKSNLERELLIKASGINRSGAGPGTKELIAVDATAGMGEDALLLAAAGFRVNLYEKDPVIAALLQDSLLRARKSEELSEIVSRMELTVGDSITAMETFQSPPDLIFLDPMFPERTKSASVKKKFQLLHLLEHPCEDEECLLKAARNAQPGRIVIKRPLKGPFLGGIRPSFSMEGKAVRYDCLLRP